MFRPGTYTGLCGTALLLPVIPTPLEPPGLLGRVPVIPTPPEPLALLSRVPVIPRLGLPPLLGRVPIIPTLLEPPALWGRVLLIPTPPGLPELLGREPDVPALLTGRLPNPPPPGVTVLLRVC